MVVIGLVAYKVTLFPSCMQNKRDFYLHITKGSSIFAARKVQGMKKSIVFTFLLVVALNVAAQEKVRHVSVELLGAQNAVGINYDSRFKGNSGLGYRVGIGYGYGDNSGFFKQTVKGVGVPIALNYLLGKKRHKLEVGFGTSLGVYHVEETIWTYTQPVPPETEGYGELLTTASNRFGYFLFGDMGYRYQREGGFIIRAGFSPSFNFGDKYGLKKAAFYPYIGFGWSF